MIPIFAALSDNILINILEIVMISAVVYTVLRFFRGTSAQAVLSGMIVLFLAVFLLTSTVLDNLQMRHLKWVFSKILPTAAIGIIIVFQPELRRAMVEIGGKVPVMFGGNTGKTAIDSIIDACLWLAGNKMGALICIERHVQLGNITEQGTAINSEVSGDLLKNIFFKNSPLHDGAVVIRGSRIVAAQCLLPMTDNREISSELGTRHRAAVGLAEATDAIVVVVSEERQKISIAVDGELEFGLRAEDVKKRLAELLAPHQEPHAVSGHWNGKSTA